MTPDQAEQIRHIVEQSLRDWQNFPWLAWIITVIILGALAFFGFYLAESGRQKAIQDALEKYTKTVEGIRSLYAEQLENLRGTHQLRIAAIDSRLAALQKAYVLWWELRGVVYKPNEVGTVIVKCQDFWKSNNLYLGSEVSEAFYRSYMCAGGHHELTQIRPRTEAVLKQIRENWEVIDKPGALIERSVDLPVLTHKRPADPSDA